MKSLQNYRSKIWDACRKPSSWNIFGAFLIILGTLFSSLSNSLIHAIKAPIPAAQLLFLKTAMGFLICSPLFINFGKRALASPNKKWHIQKALFGTIGNLFWISALQQLPLSDVTTLSLTSALLTTIGATIFFGEKLRKTTILALCLGIIGVILCVKPSFAKASITILFPLLSAVCFSFSSLVVKKVSVEDHMFVSLFYLLFGMAIFSAPIAYEVWVPLCNTEILTLLGLAILYVAIQWTLIHAYTYASAGFLAPFKFTRFPIALFVGSFYFHESITPSLLWGGFFIILGCLVIQYSRFDPSYLFTLKSKK